MTTSSTFDSALRTEEQTSVSVKPKQRRGFALLSSARMSQIASLGGRTAHQAGHAHEWTRAQAKEAAAKSVETRKAKAQARKAKSAVKVPHD